jgi:hypothetical protein
VNLYVHYTHTHIHTHTHTAELEIDFLRTCFSFREVVVGELLSVYGGFLRFFYRCVCVCVCVCV